MRHPSRRVRLLLFVLLPGLGLSAFLGPRVGRADEDAATDPLVIGTYPLTAGQAVDGDTLRLPDGLPAVRVLGIDTEERLRNEKDREAAKRDFAAYARARRGEHPRPVKYGTPAGEAATAWLLDFIVGCPTMRLERDRVGGRDKGSFGRLLAHVFVKKDGRDVNLAEETIRAGHSPVYVKYGRSARFHEAFLRAEAEARSARRGIWSDDGPAHYPDYPERIAWWRARAAQLDQWRAVADRADHITLGEPGADEKLAAHVGKQATVFGLFQRELQVSAGDRRLFLLAHQPRRGFPLVVFDAAEGEALASRTDVQGLYLRVRGTITLYKDRPQMVLAKASEVIVP